jgi:hypothetical protein
MAAGPANALDRTRRARRHRRCECHVRAEPQVVDLGTPPGKDRSGGSMHSRRPAATAALASLSLGFALGCGDLSGLTFLGGPRPPPPPLPPQENFTTTGSMSTGRYYHTATLLLDGKVLVAGRFIGHARCQRRAVRSFDWILHAHREHGLGACEPHSDAAGQREGAGRGWYGCSDGLRVQRGSL